MANWTMLLEEETEKYESLLESLAVAQVAADTTKTESAYKKARELRTAVKAASWNIIEMKLEIKMAAIAWATNDSGGFGPPRPAQEERSMKSVFEQNHIIRERLARRGMHITNEEANFLRRAEITLHRWYEKECGTERGCIERDEETGTPYLCSVQQGRRQHRIRDTETGALKRVEAFCQKKGWYFYAQSDPRGCALYVGVEPLHGANYPTKGAACCGD